MINKSHLNRKNVIEYLNQQNTYTLHRPLRINYPTRRVYVHKIDEQWQADLVDMRKYSTKNKYYNYLLTVIDCFSKYAWVIPIKKKSSQYIIDSFDIIFKHRVPKRLQTDLGKEFINKNFQSFLNKHNVKWFATDSKYKASIVERFNRTFKTMMWKYFTEKQTKKWIDIIDDLVSNYNNTHHRSIRMTPVEASHIDNQHIVYKNLYDVKYDNRNVKFNIGDKVRISKYKRVFTKGYLPNFTNEVFVISDVLNTHPTTYKIKDLKDNEITGIFYESELVIYNKK